jgi:hypothetical protein
LGIKIKTGKVQHKAGTIPALSTRRVREKGLAAAKNSNIPRKSLKRRKRKKEERELWDNCIP